ncbi:hypothetical protein TanjilG_10840 [Lupinus angustifolius]|uniref:Uncharacterized protein n=1 Tax=Lupinus angustifolius TaxID=3871 RepID=A0A1J7GM97_LUPAN|nr:hypothetical protein TanjilG_10840 [Lupinus angustifolius]
MSIPHITFPKQKKANPPATLNTYTTETNLLRHFFHYLARLGYPVLQICGFENSEECSASTLANPIKAKPSQLK